MTSEEMRRKVDGAVSAEKREHDRKMREMTTKLKTAEREGAAAKDKNQRLEEASRVEAYVHQKKETRLANSVTDADAKRDQAMKRAAAAETSMRSEVAQANNAEKRARREASISEVEKNAALNAVLEQKDKLKEERRRQMERNSSSSRRSRSSSSNRCRRREARTLLDLLLC
jgi:hypothetical protein